MTSETSSLNHTPTATRAGAMLLLLAYTGSGITALSYEVLWARLLGLQFGVSIFGVVVTIAAFMAGLGLGSVWGARLRPTPQRAVLWFAGIEAAVALFAMALPTLQQGLDPAWRQLASGAGLGAWYGVQGVAAFVVLLLPASALGVAFPLVVRALEPSGTRLGAIYGMNTLGGVLGALLPLVLLPPLGWSLSVRVIALLGLLIAAGSALLSRRFSGTAQMTAAPPTTATHIPRLSLWAYAGIGAAALMLEVGWTRLLGLLLLRTEYVLAVLLAVFLVGIALGSLVARYLRGPQWLNVLPVVAGAGCILGLWALPVVADWAERSRFDSLGEALLWQGGVIAALTLPVTLVFGAWLPLLTARWGGGGARLYGANALGAAAGALLAGFVLIPLLGTPATIGVAAALLWVCGMAWANRRWPWGAALGVAILSFPVMSGWPVHTLLPTTQHGTQDLMRYEDAVSITHVVERNDGQRLLLTDLQRMDAASDPTAVAVQQNQARLPLLLHPAPHSVLFLGVGTGVSASGSLPFPQLTRVGVELSPGAIQAAQIWFAPVNHGITAQMELTRDDARRFLLRETRHFDVIIGDLFHPDLAGHSTLLTVQQFERAHARLAPGGLFVQWLALNQFDTRSLGIVLRSFQRVFPDAVIFVDGFRLALVGPRDALGGAPAMLANLARMSAEQQRRATGGEGAWTWLGRYWGRIADGYVSTAGPLQDEWSPQIEFLLPRARFHNETDLAQLLDGLLRRRPSLDDAATALHVTAADQETYMRGYAAAFFALRSWLVTLRNGDGAEAQHLMRSAFQANPLDRWVGFDLADKWVAALPQARREGRDERGILLEALRLRPDHTEALRALWHLERASGNTLAAEGYRARLARLSPLDTEVRGLMPRK